jgi:hypothetical protein
VKDISGQNLWESGSSEAEERLNAG